MKRIFLNNVLKSIFQTRIELSNIIKIYRLKKFYQAEPKTIKGLLIKKNTRISEKKIDEIIALSNPDAILKYLSTSEFSRFSSDKDYIYVEYYAGRIRFDLAKKFMYSMSIAVGSLNSARLCIFCNILL